MRGDDDHSRKVRFYPFELDLSTGELCKYGQRVRIQRQPLLILNGLLAKPGETVTREELRELIWPGCVFVDYEHSLNRSMNKLRRVLADKADKPRYIETVHGRGYRFIAPVQGDASHGAIRLAVLPIVNPTRLPENNELAETITEALIDGLGSVLKDRVGVISLASVLPYRNRWIRVARVAAELRADYLVWGRLRSEKGQSLLRVELVDLIDGTVRWAGSFHFGDGGLGLVRKEICEIIAVSVEKEFLSWNGLRLVSAS